jgi:tetratricopeptide (TPR) repeat protein
MLKQLNKLFLFCAFISLGYLSYGQSSIFDDDELIALIKGGADGIYNLDNDTTDYYIKAVKSRVPNHPIVPMMEAMNTLWNHIPVLEDDVFELFNQQLLSTIEASQNLSEDNPDGIFFEMSARGLLAEYYADRGAYMKALSEASQAYALLKDGFDYSEEYPEYLFAVGLYNYFREAYPDKHPIYRPLMWFFRSGDKSLGISQLKRATRETVILRVEAYVYLSYIYLRYEEKPELSQQFITELYEEYPTNPYVQAKYLEAHHGSKNYVQLKPEVISRLQSNQRPYYRMIGNLYGGIVSEIVNQQNDKALEQYKNALTIGEQLPGYGDYYKSLLHLGMGRIYKTNNQDSKAMIHLDKAISHAQTREIIDEANKWKDR